VVKEEGGHIHQIQILWLKKYCQVDYLNLYRSIFPITGWKWRNVCRIDLTYFCFQNHVSLNSETRTLSQNQEK